MRDILLFLTVAAFLFAGYIILCVSEKKVFSDLHFLREKDPSSDGSVLVIPENASIDAKIEAFSSFAKLHEDSPIIVMSDQGKEAASF